MLKMANRLLSMPAGGSVSEGACHLFGQAVALSYSAAVQASVKLWTRLERVGKFTPAVISSEPDSLQVTE